MNYTDEELSKLNGYKWSNLLKEQPQLADKCDFSKLDGDDWSNLLRKQPQLADKCDFSKLNGYDWSYLLKGQPQFYEKCLKYAIELGCGSYNRAIYIDRRIPYIIHIGCFSGTKEEAIKAIVHKYRYPEDYCSKVESCFNKLNMH